MLPIKVLLFPRNESALIEHLAQFHLLQSDGRFSPKLVSASSPVALAIGQAGLSRDVHIAFAPVAAQDQGHFSRIEKAWTGLMSSLSWFQSVSSTFSHDRIAHSTPLAFWRFLSTRKSLRATYQSLAALIDREAPDIILLSGDRELGVVPVLCRVAADRAIPAVVSLTSAVAVNASAEIAQRKAHHRFQTKLNATPSLWNLVIRWSQPGLVSNSVEQVLFSPGWLISALRAEGMLNANPWFHGGGTSSHIVVEGHRKKKAFQSGGVPAEKILLTGSVMHDRLHSARLQRAKTRGELMKNSGSKSQKLVLLAVPSFAEQGLTDWRTHIAELRAVARVLSTGNIAVVISLHPKSDAERYDFLRDDFGFQISREPLESLVSAADIYVAGNSTTIEMATLCGVPVINLDYIRLSVAYWDDYPGVVRTTDAVEFERELNRLLSDEDYFDRQSQAQRAVANDIGLFDGRCGGRFKAALVAIAQARLAGTCASSG